VGEAATGCIARRICRLAALQLLAIVPLLLVVVGAAGKAANLGGGESLYRQLPDNGRLVYLLLGEVTDRDMRRRKSPGCLAPKGAAVGAIGGASKSAGLKIID
jgi:hypothetical protein